MTTLDHLDASTLLTHARRLVDDPDAPQEDLRAAISAAYYAVFHDVCRRAATQIAGRPAQDAASPAVSVAIAQLVRWFSHRALLDAGQLVQGLDRAAADPTWHTRRVAAWELLHDEQPHPLPGHLLAVIRSIRMLQDMRQSASYDRVVLFGHEQALDAITLAEEALDLLRQHAQTPAYRAFFVLVTMSARNGARV
ncbi:hypothetical protein [Conexibacter woesei]|uniref:Uncharacterized protein n=1 Tax=Conexibacter woesei (strain DSM 14684 / CCUG 47730 / CIP 108061 / JCM 11494 / NBRC 100937 / ID131577) TaxID=469383 RepID=D3FAA1_CONWI|nr:hypothetical protein [Conexibacter woesei]ADB49170.1 hypothetical protein Cwoe_0737 [Conexibacter woesei DSM 14684]